MAQLIEDDTLVVVADGHGATLYRTKGDGEAMTLTQEAQHTPKNLADESASGSAPSEQSPRDADEATFAKQLAHALYQMKHGGAFEALVLYADPATLGQIRASLHKTVEDSIILDAAKTLTHHSTKDIAAMIVKAA